MHRTHHPGAAVALAFAALALGACSASAEEPTGLSTTSATPEEATPTAEATPSPPAPSPDASLDLELPPGLVVEDPPEVEGAELAALETYLKFEAEYWKSLLDSELSAELAQLAVDDVTDQVADQVDVQVREGFTLGGTLRIDAKVEGATGDVAVVSACLDQSGVTVIRDGEEEIGADAAKNPTFSATADLAFRGDGWTITNYQTDMEQCESPE